MLSEVYMGHLYPKNFSKIANRQFKERGCTTIKAVVDEAIEKGQTAHAAEGKYGERYMIEIAVDVVFTFLAGYNTNDTKYIKPLKPLLTKEQKARLSGDEGEWDERDYEICNSIVWVICKKKLPVLKYVDM